MEFYAWGIWFAVITAVVVLCDTYGIKLSGWSAVTIFISFGCMVFGNITTSKRDK